MKYLRLVCLLLLNAMLWQAHAADVFPSRPMTIIVPGAAGSLPDQLARPIAERLRQSLGQPVVIINKPGAGGLVAMQDLKGAPADGHTLAMIANSHAIWNPYIFDKLPYDPVADLVPVSPVAVIPMALAVHKDLPVNNVAELIALARRQPGKLNYGSSGNGTPPHVLFEMFKRKADVHITHIPFRTAGDAMKSLLANEVQVFLVGASLAEPLVKDGRIKLLAVSPALPQVFDGVPTLAAQGFDGFEGVIWYGFATNAGVPAPLVERLNREIRQVVGDPAISEGFRRQGSLAYQMSATDYAQQIRQDRALWTPVLQALKIKPD